MRTGSEAPCSRHFRASAWAASRNVPSFRVVSALGCVFKLGESPDVLWSKVHELPEPIHETVNVYYHEGESVREVARALGVSRPTVKSRLHRGRNLLRDELWREPGQSLRDMLPSTRRRPTCGPRQRIQMLPRPHR